MGDELLGQTVVVIGGSAGIGLETARRARAEGAEVDPHRARHRAPGARGDRGRRDAARAAFDATDFDRLDQFFDGAAGADRPCDGDRPAARTTGRWPTMDFDQAAATSSSTCG